MSRKLLVQIHLYLATFLAPIVLMIAISGGLYLFGLKGSVEKEVVYQNNVSELALSTGIQASQNISIRSIEQDISTIFTQVGIDTTYEYIKTKGNTLYTRPTSKEYYSLSLVENNLTITKETPDFIKSMVELHKGHGPTLFKTLQKVTAFGLVFILLSGLWLALANKSMRGNALITVSLGFVVFIALALT